MGFFDNKQKSSAVEAKPASPAYVPPKPAPQSSSDGTKTSTRIGPNMTIDGQTRGDEDLLVDGTVKGQLTCSRHITVGKTGVVKADIKCHSIHIMGQVQGNVEADESITIGADGKLTGDITARTFVNEPGGFFEGYSHMVKDDAKTNQPQAPKHQNDRNNKKK